MMPLEMEPVLRMLVAALLSLPIGLEREISGKPAGVRTHLLLAATTAALGWLSIEVARGDPSADPTRIASYTVAGVGFLGAGVIIGIRGRVHGLTTAVAAFTVMAIGVLTGTGHGGAATGLMLLSLLALGPLEWVKPTTYGRWIRTATTVHVLVSRVDELSAIQRVVTETGLVVHESDLQRVDDHIIVVTTVRGRPEQLRAVVAALEADSAVVAVTAVTGDAAFHE